MASYPPASKPIHSLNLHEKLLKIGRNIPCTAEDQTGEIHNKCQCLGWKPKTNNTGRADLCACGHRVSWHGHNNSLTQEILNARLEIAMKIDNILESKDKLQDFEYEDAELKSLRQQLIAIGESPNPNKRKLVDDYENGFSSNKPKLDEPIVHEKPAMAEERLGTIAMKVLTNDDTIENLTLLTGLKNLIKIQLPNMPPEYITRLVYDKRHYSLAIIKGGNRVVGGITYRLFPENKLAEIVFCVVSSTEQAKGYGSHLMNDLKDLLKEKEGIKHLMTYADNHAMGFFKKNGFTTDITLDKGLWMGFIKDYDEATIMQCTMIEKVKYKKLHEILAMQRRAIKNEIAVRKNKITIYKGLDISKNKPINPLDIPGIRESGWNEEMEARVRGNKKSIRNIMASITVELKKYPKSWPFRTPVNRDEVPDYYNVIKNPMDLATIESKVENNYYKSIEDYASDVRTIFLNCRLYNAEGTIYVKCAAGLEKYFNERLKYYDVCITNDKKKVRLIVDILG
ncbi:3447_t:CDS:10 [Acaulospora morrowiae]|uniref:histone acetyltransferase n=1 Tax=Acaulospora morrowiae TaxID=94023 RepID=A0A9N8YWG4_9GLOM|nr:3447_t:CDS:10 [Acaulospora morrowiae]